MDLSPSGVKVSVYRDPGMWGWGRERKRRGALETLQADGWSAPFPQCWTHLDRVFQSVERPVQL